MQTRSGAEIVVDGDVVYKLHRPGTDRRALSARLRTAARLDCFLGPLSTEPARVGARWRTRWPRVETVVPEPGCLPWADAARLLARLHAEPVGDRLPPHGWPGRLRRTAERLRGTDTDAIGGMQVVVRCEHASPLYLCTLERQSLCESHRQRRWLTCWSYNE